MNWIHTTTLTVACALVAVACSTAPQREYIDIPAFSTIALVGASDLPNIDALLTPQEHVRDKAGKGATVGMASGLASGVILCGLTGPFAGLCVSGLGLAGWAAGGVGGLAYGIAIADAEGEGATEINEHIQRVVSGDTLNADLLDELHGLLPATVLSPADAADVAASPVLSGVEVGRTQEGSIKLKFTADLLFSWEDAAGETFFGRAQFKHRSTDAPVEHWLADGGAMFDAAFSKAIAAFSNKMRVRIEQRLAQGAQTLEVERSAPTNTPLDTTELRGSD